ncbi:MAG: TetR/AcrR family transcriptional regulator [Paludibacter sp.]|nr:TetR/AcrR family transcriptional regulator [Paludibacter sp.]
MESTTEKSMEQQILETAEELFLAKGFSAVSTVQIARECGCNQALVHYYFRTKDNLFNTIFEKKFRLFFNSIMIKDQAKKLSFTEKLQSIIESHFDLLQANPQLPILVLSELMRRPEQIELLKSKLQAKPTQLFAELNAEMIVEVQAGRIRKLDIIDLMMSMLSLNIALFVSLPAIGIILNLSNDQKKELIGHRRQEHVSFVLNSIILK